MTAPLAPDAEPSPETLPLEGLLDQALEESFPASDPAALLRREEDR